MMRRMLSRHAMALVFFALVGGFGWAMGRELGKPTRGEDGCLITGAPVVQVALLDSSDPVPDATLRRLVRRIVEIALGLGPDVRFMLVTLGGASELDLVPVFSGCNPANGSGDLAGEAYRRRMTEKFLAEILPFMTKLGDGERSTSPILEGVERLRYFREIFEAEEAHLVLASDLIQNSPGISHIPGLAGYRRPSADNVPVPDPHAPGTWASVTLIQLQRVQLRKLQTPEQTGWWISFFSPISSTPPVLEKF